MWDKSINIILAQNANFSTKYFILSKVYIDEGGIKVATVNLQWLQHLGNHEIMFETGEVRANECY